MGRVSLSDRGLKCACFTGQLGVKRGSKVRPRRTLFGMEYEVFFLLAEWYKMRRKERKTYGLDVAAGLRGAGTSQRTRGPNLHK